MSQIFGRLDKQESMRHLWGCYKFLLINVPHCFGYTGYDVNDVDDALRHVCIFPLSSWLLFDYYFVTIVYCVWFMIVYFFLLLIMSYYRLLLAVTCARNVVLGVMWLLFSDQAWLRAAELIISPYWTEWSLSTCPCWGFEDPLKNASGPKSSGWLLSRCFVILLLTFLGYAKIAKKDVAGSISWLGPDFSFVSSGINHCQGF